MTSGRPSERPRKSAAALRRCPCRMLKPLFGYDAPEDEDRKPADVRRTAWTRSRLFDPAHLRLQRKPRRDWKAPRSRARNQVGAEAEGADRTADAGARPGAGGAGESRQKRRPRRLRRQAGRGPRRRHARERDEARMEVIVLRSRNEAAEQTRRDTDAMASQLEELSHVIDERDSVRRDYAVAARAVRDAQARPLAARLARGQPDNCRTRPRACASSWLRQRAADPAGAPVKRSGTAQAARRKPPRQRGGEIAALQESEVQAGEGGDVAAAHRGLALSQKALQETKREALREATEGTSQSKGNLEEIEEGARRASLVPPEHAAAGAERSSFDPRS